MLNHRYTLLLACIAILLASCQEYKQNIYINEDGSGKLTLTYDIGEMMQMMEGAMEEATKEMGEGIQESMEEEEESPMEEVDSMELDSAEMAELLKTIEDAAEEELEEMEEEGEELESEEDEQDLVEMLAEIEKERQEKEARQNPLSKAVSNFFDELEPKKGQKVDTAFTLYEIVPDSLKHHMDRPELAKKMGLDIMFDEEAKEAEVSIQIDFDQYSQINEIFSGVKEMFGDKEDPSKSAQIDQIENQMQEADINLKKGYIKVKSSPFEDELGEEMNFDEMKEDELKMMEMFFGGSISTTYHLPSEVLSCTFENAQIDGNKITINEKILDMMKNKQMAGYEIKFKPIN